VKQERYDLEKHVRAIKIRLGSHNLEGKLQRRLKESEELSKILDNIRIDSLDICTKIDIEKESC
jgi:hypothetical protein